MNTLTDDFGNSLLAAGVIDKDRNYSVTYDATSGDAIIRVAVNHIMPSTIQQMIMEAVQAAVRNHPYYTTEIETMVKDAFQSQIEDIVAKETKKLVDEQVSKHKRIETTRFPPALIPPVRPPASGTDTIYPYDYVEDWPEPTDFWNEEKSGDREFWENIRRKSEEWDKQAKKKII